MRLTLTLLCVAAGAAPCAAQFLPGVRSQVGVIRGPVPGRFFAVPTNPAQVPLDSRVGLLRFGLQPYGPPLAIVPVYPYYPPAATPALRVVPIGLGVPTPGVGYVRPINPLGPSVPAGPRAVPTPADGRARLVLQVPAGARVWLGGQEMAARTGASREYVTPPLRPGRPYTYDLRVEWPGPDGKPVRRDRKVPIRAGQVQSLSFFGG